MDVETRATCFVSVAPVAADGQEQPDFCVRVYQPRVLVPAEDQVCGEHPSTQTSHLGAPLTLPGLYASLVTGSAHSDILPHFLSKIAPKAEGEEYVSHQVSARGGRLGLVPLAGGKSVSLRGRGVIQTYKAGTIEI